MPDTGVEERVAAVAAEIETIAGIERDALHHRSVGERVRDASVGLIGRLSFLLAHLAWVGVSTELSRLASARRDKLPG